MLIILFLVNYNLPVILCVPCILTVCIIPVRSMFSKLQCVHSHVCLDRQPGVVERFYDALVTYILSNFDILSKYLFKY